MATSQNQNENEKNNPKNKSSELQKDTWPRYLMMEASDPNQPIDLNVFALKKAIDGMANGVPKSVKKLRSGSVFIEVDKKQQCLNLLRTTKLQNYLPVKVSPHRTLNSSKFVIRCPDLNDMEEEEIKKELRPQGISEVKRISARYDLYLLTINSPSIPDSIKIGYLNVKTRAYIPNPQRCFKCQKYGHTKNRCQGKDLCAGCGQEGHTMDDCPNDPHCLNCNGDHRAISRDCPVWKKEKEIVTLKYTEKITFAEARRRLMASTPDASQNTYANVTQNQAPQQPSWSRNIQPPSDFSCEKDWLHYVINHFQNRLDFILRSRLPPRNDRLDEISLHSNRPLLNTQSTTESPSIENESLSATASCPETPTATTSNIDPQMDLTITTAKRPIEDVGSGEDSPHPLPPKKATSVSSAIPVRKITGDEDGAGISKIPLKGKTTQRSGGSEGGMEVDHDFERSASSGQRRFNRPPPKPPKPPERTKKKGNNASNTKSNR